MITYHSLNSLFDYMRKQGKQSYNTLSKKFNTSTTSIYRKLKKIKARSCVPGADFFETEEGRDWAKRLVVAVILVFGVICNVGAERLSLFFSLISLTAFVGLSASSVGRIENKVDTAIDKYRKEHDLKVQSEASNIELVIGADETFFKDVLILVLMDMKSGFIFCEETAKNRQHTTWEKVSTPWLSKFKKITCLVSDRAKAIIKLASDSLSVPSIADLFHLMQDVSKVMGLAIDRQIKAVTKGIEQASTKDNPLLLTELQTKQDYIISSKKQYNSSYRELSTNLHPFNIVTNDSQNTETVTQKMLVSLNKISDIKDNLLIVDKEKGLEKAKKQIPEAAQQIDVWWDGVNNSLEGSILDPEQKDWLMHIYLPTVYWKLQIRKTRSKTIKKMYQSAYTRSQARITTHTLTSTMLNKYDNLLWENWATQMCSFFQRTSSPIEGRNGWLSQMHFVGRGLSGKRIRSQTTIHNYFLEREDATTACERLSGIKPDNLFEFILKEIGPLPEPRRAKQTKAVGLCIQGVTP